MAPELLGDLTVAGVAAIHLQRYQHQALIAMVSLSHHCFQQRRKLMGEQEELWGGEEGRKGWKMGVRPGGLLRGGTHRRGKQRRVTAAVEINENLAQTEGKLG